MTGPRAAGPPSNMPRVVITDVTTDPGFAPHREIALAPGFRAVQSTPLVNRAGHLVGMLSTHYPRPTTSPRRDLQVVSRFGALAGESLSTLLNGARLTASCPLWPGHPWIRFNQPPNTGVNSPMTCDSIFLDRSQVPDATSTDG